MRDGEIRRKKKKKGVAGLIAEIVIISLLAVCAVAGGVYCAKIYTTPYSSEIVESFEEGTLDVVEIAKEKYNILILGTDKSGLLTDVMMLAQIDPVHEKATVMSIPRDTYIKYKGMRERINAVHSLGHKKNKKGAESSIIAVKELTGIPIHHYVKVNFKAFRQCIDELGGVDFNVPQRMKYSDPYQDLYIDLKKGQQHLDGDKAEQLVRFRRYPNGDIDRIKVQQEFMHELASQKLKPKYVGKIDNIYSVVMSNMETSMSPDDFVECGSQLLKIGTENIGSLTLPTTFVDGQSYVKPLPEEIAKTRRDTFGYTLVAFEANGKTVAGLAVSTGETLKEKDFPQVPEKSGYTGKWDYEGDIEAGADKDITVKAVYTRKN